MRENTRKTLERCEDARRQRENPWWRQLHEAICSLPEMAQAVIGITVGSMGMLVVFNMILGAIIV